MSKKTALAAARALKKALFRIKQAGLPEGGHALATAINPDILPALSLPDRIKAIHNLFHTQKPDTQALTFFIFYDIENDKIRNHLAKYLIRMGCERIQKSVFLARLERSSYEQIFQTLKQVQENYDNQDSVMMVPIPEDDVRVMKIIGSTEAVDVVLSNRNVLFY